MIIQYAHLMLMKKPSDMSHGQVHLQIIKLILTLFYMVINFIFLTEVECFMIIKENC